MLTSITVDIKNNPYKGGMEITSVANIESLGSLTSVAIHRSENNGSYEDVHTIELSELSDLNFHIIDLGTKSGSLYEYSIDLKAGDEIVETGYYDAGVCRFCGLFVGNANKQYIAGTNFKTETKRNIQREYVTTLAGKYPYAVSNSETNYTTGTSVGLFLELTEDKKKFLPDTYHTYSNAVIDFLTDGSEKVLKTHDGQAWYISIDPSPNTVYSEFLGLNAVQFSWTEIGAVPLDYFVEVSE